MGGVARVAEMIQELRGAARAGSRSAAELEEIAQGARGLRMTEWEAGLAQSRSGLQRVGREAEMVEVEAGANEARGLFDRRVAGQIAEEQVVREMEVAQRGMWDKTKDFAKVLGIEVMKGFAMGLGFEIAITAWHAIVEKLSGNDKENFQRKIDACDNANKVLPKILDDWNTWLTTHFAERDTFGTIEVSSITISKFQTFQASKSSLVTIQTEEVIPALTIAARSINALGLTPLIEKLQKMSEHMLKIAKAITNDYQAMQAKQLQDHTSEIQGVLDKLKAA